MNQVVMDLLKTLPLEERSLWPEKLPDLVDLYNHIPVGSTNCTPAYLMRARPGKLPVDLEMGVLTPEDTSPETDWDTERQQQYRKVQESVERSLCQARERQEKTYNQYAPAVPLVPGEQVLKRKRRLHKLDDQWEKDPYTVLPSSHENPKVCTISKDGGETTAIVSRDHLKKCPEQLRNPEEEQEDHRPVEEREDMVSTVLGDFPRSWTQVNGAVVVPVLTFLQPSSQEPKEQRVELEEQPVQEAEDSTQAEQENPPSAYSEPAVPLVRQRAGRQLPSLPLTAPTPCSSGPDSQLRRSTRATRGQLPARWRI
ncbi:uncharacterized protein [Phyllobates terribilis]|uniref:uncharacterized protein n=1 Tax=Phyllobates terribilis TaxID=111132 RepID=UPI003CCAA92E